MSDWIKLFADWWLPAHLYVNATFQCVGIEEDFSLGENIKITRQDGQEEVYHIEGYTHSFNVDPVSGRKIFRTSLQCTRGQKADGSFLYEDHFTSDIEDSIGITSVDEDDISERSNEDAGFTGDGGIG